MKRMMILIGMVALTVQLLRAQSFGIEPFTDAVAFSRDHSPELFLSNRTASDVKDFFVQAAGDKPVKVIPISDGYNAGYRICYSTGNCRIPGKNDQWVQVYTVNTAECIRYYESENPDVLMAPFSQIRDLTTSSGHTKAEFNKVYNHYKHLSCRMYRQTGIESGGPLNEMTQLVEQYKSKVQSGSSMMLASEGEGVLMRPVDIRQFNWNLWLKCFDEIEQSGYKTLIEYSQPPR